MWNDAGGKTSQRHDLAIGLEYGVWLLGWLTNCNTRTLIELTQPTKRTISLIINQGWMGRQNDLAFNSLLQVNK